MSQILITLYYDNLKKLYYSTKAGKNLDLKSDFKLRKTIVLSFDKNILSLSYMFGGSITVKAKTGNQNFNQCAIKGHVK